MKKEKKAKKPVKVKRLLKTALENAKGGVVLDRTKYGDDGLDYNNAVCHLCTTYPA